MFTVRDLLYLYCVLFSVLLAVYPDLWSIRDHMGLLALRFEVRMHQKYHA